MLGESDKALETFTKLAEAGGKDWADRAWFQIGQAQATANRYEEAVTAFGKVETVAPQSPLIPEARLSRAEALLKLGRRDEALPTLKALAADGPRNLAAQAAFVLGSSELESGDPALAFETLDGASKKYAQTPLAAALTFRSAEAAVKLNKLDDARAVPRGGGRPERSLGRRRPRPRRAASLDQGDSVTAAKLAATFLERFPRVLAGRRPARLRPSIPYGRQAQGRDRDAHRLARRRQAQSDQPPAPNVIIWDWLTAPMANPPRPPRCSTAWRRAPPLRSPPTLSFSWDSNTLRRTLRRGRRPARKIPRRQARWRRGRFRPAHLVQARLELNEPDAALKALNQLSEKFPKSKALAPSRVRWPRPRSRPSNMIARRSNSRRPPKKPSIRP